MSHVPHRYFVRTILAASVSTTLACGHAPLLQTDAHDAALDATSDRTTDAAPADGRPTDAPVDIFTAPDRILLSATTQIPIGEERYQCAIFDWHRDGGIVVSGVSPQMGPGVHHANVYWESEADGVIDPVTGCPTNHSWHPIYTSGIGTQDLRFPPQTGFPLADGARLVLEVHYVNATAAALDTGASVTLELLDPGTSFIPIGVLSIGDTDLILPPHQQTTIRADCSQHETLENVFLAFPHMHHLGTSIRTLVDGVPLVDVDHWNTTDQPLVPIDPPATITDDQTLTTECNFNNTTDGTVRLGPYSTDEMCFVTLYYWPATTDNGAYCQDMNVASDGGDGGT